MVLDQNCRNTELTVDVIHSRHNSGGHLESVPRFPSFQLIEEIAMKPYKVISLL